jgi:NitT/TauT family transport system substrate-binding protein
LALTHFAPIFIAQERGYFQELGLRVEEEPFSNATEMRPALVSGQLHVAGGGLSVGTMNAISRETDVKVVADMESARNARESADALVVRKELWDRGTIRRPKDLEGFEIFAPGGIGSGIHIALLRWAEREQLDLTRLTMTQMGTTEIRVALANGVVDVAHLSEPNIAAAVSAGQAEVLAWIGEMYPGQHQLVLLYNVKAIEQAGEVAGERFMIAYLRAVREYLDAFFQDKGTDSVIDILVKNTLIKDREIYRRAQMHWADPNGRVNMADLASDVELLIRVGVIRDAPNLTQAHDPSYAEFAGRYLGEYRSNP